MEYQLAIKKKKRSVCSMWNNLHKYMMGKKAQNTNTKQGIQYVYFYVENVYAYKCIEIN